MQHWVADLGCSGACIGPVAENFLLRESGSICLDRMVKPSLLVSAAPDSSEMVAAGRVGDTPKGRQATGKPSPETSCETRQHFASSLLGD